jgi:hypothetical protein
MRPDSLTSIEASAEDRPREEILMALMLTVVVTVCFIASLLPFMLPGAVIGLLGKVLNDALGDPLWALIPAVRGTLVVSGSEGPVLTLRGVLAVYVPLLVLLLWSQRGR